MGIWRQSALLFAVLSLGACEEPIPETPQGARVLVCGSEIASLVTELGGAANVLATDTLSRAGNPRLANSTDLGPNCRDAATIASGLPVDSALLTQRDSLLGAELERLGIPTLIIAPVNLDEVLEVHRRLGTLLANERRALILSAAVTRGIGETSVKRDGRTRLRVAWVLGPSERRDEWEVVGGVGVLHELLELAGAENAFHGSKTPRDRVNVEELSAADAAVWLVAPGTENIDRYAPIPGAEVRIPSSALHDEPILDPLQRVEALHSLLYPGAD